MWWLSSRNTSEYDVDWKDQPTTSWFDKWVLGLLIPMLMVVFGIHIVLSGQGEFFANHAQMTLRGSNATAYATAIISGALFLHCHYLWGSIYDGIWFAVLGKIISLCGMIAGLIYLCIRVGVLGRN